jgi:mono/diheme cytochrome c family protein
LARGLAVAERACASCHIVREGGQGPAQPGVPSFSAIARHAGQTPERLAGIIIVPHPPMPPLQLTISEIRDVVAYIRSLAPRQ